ncbi:MAG: phosphoribosylamine--glycine ligase [Phycisphaerales bacterium]|nr:phosphoribosylamine--glycine ligase [Phycisphaerales bacterium]
MATETLNVLLVGGGGREHALAWKLKQSPRCGTLFATPDGMSNPGIAALAKPVDFPWDLKDAFRIQRWCVSNRIGLAVIGPEEPLCMGLADILRGEESGVGSGGLGGLGGAVPAVFGPSRQAAQLEGDKSFCKDVLRQASVPTAEGRAFTDYEQARAFLESRTEAQVIKACGLAKGKGVFVPANSAEALAALDRIMVKKEFGDAGRKVLIEERLKGREVSIFALVDGRTIYVLETCQDHKRLLDGARGPNTGGMGAICPASRAFIDDAMLDRVQREVLVPTIDAMKRDGIEYSGVLYAGIMLTPGGPKVLEYNCRFGDPECQALMARLDTDLVDVLEGVATRRLDQVDLRWKGGDAATAVCVVLAAEGYPERPRGGSVITGIEEAERAGEEAGGSGALVFHAGTRLNEKGEIVTSGGRVLSVVGTGKDPASARSAAYGAAERVRFAGMQMRRDIGTEVVG